MVQQSSFLSRGSSGGAVGAEGGGRGRGRGKWEQRGGAEGGGSGSRGGAEGAGGAVEVAFHTAHPWAVNHIQKSLIRRKSKTVKAVKQPWNGIRLFYTIIRWKWSNNFYFLCCFHFHHYSPALSLRFSLFHYWDVTLTWRCFPFCWVCSDSIWMIV